MTYVVWQKRLWLCVHRHIYTGKNSGVNSLVMPHNRGVLRLLVPYGTCNANRPDSLYMIVHKLLSMLYAKTYGTS